MVRFVFGVLFQMAFCASIFAQPPRPNTLTAKELADGWILLFDGESSFGWKIEGDSRVENGMLVLGGAKGAVASSTMPFGPCRLYLEFALIQGKERGTLTLGETKTLLTLDTLNEFGFSNSTVGTPVRATIPVAVKIPPGSKVGLRNVKLQPSQPTPLFNGKDLAGWRTFQGDKYKSKFSVNEKGELNVKDGPGDLQTVSKHKDFVLQLECISNGKHLNSGIFFRCRENEYQNGYEAQIRNQFTDQPTQKYVVEEYDPKTNMLLAKKEVLSTAFDFGTGAIYRRIPARKEMSRDNEWFAMTVVAHGNRLGTWVNGVQVVDWTDNRPKSDNARTGCKLDAGHISIQGHDPTTDLSFRNLRIAEFK